MTTTPHRCSQAALDETVAYLHSGAAAASISADPYWPKWDSPWWRMTLLRELGLASLVPGGVVEAMLRALRTHYLPVFPLRDDQLPAGKDAQRHVICHCAVGTMMQVLDACDVDVDAELPWMRPWLLGYQLPDGGLNCDERAYSRPQPRSSMVSTLPALEAVLRCTRRALTEQEARFLDAGAQYLIAHRLARRASGDGGVIDARWLAPCFPRFYHYDVLRGLAFLGRWAEARRRAVPTEAIAEALAHLERQHTAGAVVIGRRAAAAGAFTRRCQADVWVSADDARSFALLDEAGAPGRESPELGRELEETLSRLGR